MSENQGNFIIIGQEGCPMCEMVHEMYEKEITAGNVVFIDVDSADGKKFDSMFKIEEVPFVLFHDTKKDDYLPADILEDGENLKLVIKEPKAKKGSKK